MGLGGYGPSSFSIDVPIPTDERGLVGRRCPACLGYFKLKLGTGLPTETCHCPYCGYAADISEFTTPEQEEYVLSVGMRETQEHILKPMMRRFGESLKGIERATSRGPVQIRVEVRDQWRSIPLALYREREVETDVTCQECGLQFAVFGVFATCPDCTGMNASAVFHKSLEAVRRRLSLLDGDLDSEMIEGLLSDALGSAVGAFDAVGKELRRRFPGLLPPTPHNLFQNVEALSAALGKATERSLAEALGEKQYTSLTRMFQVRHVYEHSLGVVDAQAINKVPGLAAWRGRKYVLTRSEVESFLQSLSEAYDAAVRLLEGTSSRRASQRSTAPRQSSRGTAVRPRSRDVNTKDDRNDVFGIPYKPPERDEAVTQYQRRSMHKLHIADWHKAEFERLEGELTTADFFDFDTERFLPAQAHADGALIQLAAGFDAFACAVAHHYGLENPDRASLWETKWVARLVEATERDLREILHAVVEDPKFAGLKFYRNLAAHRGVIGEQQRGGEVEEVGVDGVRFMLPDWLPMEAPDHPSYSVRPVLRKYLEWGRPALAGLNAVASAVWVPAEHESGELVFTDEMFEDVPPTELVEMELGVPRAPTRQDLAPRIGDWRAWFEWGSHNFADGSTVAPAWYLQRDEDEPISLQGVGLKLDELRSWLEREADPLTAKAVLWHYRPETIPLSMGKVMAPRVVR